MTKTMRETPGVSFPHPYRLLALIVCYLALLGACGWYVTRWASYPPDAQPYTHPLRTRPSLTDPSPPPARAAPYR